MGYVVTLEGLVPSARFDGVPWTSVDILESSAADGTFTLIDSQSIEFPDIDPSKPQVRKFTTSNASGQYGYYRVKFYDAAGGYQETTTIGITPGLITLDEFKTYNGLSLTDYSNDDHYVALIEAASLAVKTYTGRDFTVSNGETSARDYLYDGCGYLDIDDCTAVTSLSTDAGVPGQTYTLESAEWQASPYNGPVFYYLTIFGGGYLPASPEMGFERNLDKYGYVARPPVVSVTASWGWPEIPTDVKLATSITAASLAETPESDGLTSESIEGFSRSWGGGGNSTAVGLGIPNRARDFLVGYQRLYA